MDVLLEPLHLDLQLEQPMPQLEMEWFEKYVHGRAYAWEKAPVEATKEAPKPTTASGQIY